MAEADRPGEPEAVDGVAAAPRRRLTIDLAPLRDHREFRLLWTGKGISYFGSQITRIAIPFQVYDLTRSTLAVGLVALGELVPILGLSLWGGAVADAVDRRRILIRTDLVLMALTLALAGNALLPRPSLPLIYVVAVLSAGVFCFGRPALDAAVPRLVPPSQLSAAAALNGLQFTIGGIVGPAVGGVLVAATGVAGAYALDAVTFAAAIAAGVAMRPLPPSERSERPSLRAIGEGLRYARGNKPLLGTYVIDVVAMVFGMPDALLPALAIERFGGGAQALGLLAAAPAAGAFMASLVSGWTGSVRRHGLAITWAVVAWGLSITVFGFADWLPLALVAAAAAGAADMVSGIFRQTMWNQVVPDHLRGRLAGVELASYASGPALGNFEAGAVASLTSLRFSIVSGGLACVVGAGAVALLLPAFIAYRAPEPEE